MLKRINRPSHATVVAYLALFIALGGASYAAIKLPKNSVGTKQIKKNAVTGLKVQDGSLTPADVSGLQAPAAVQSGPATPSGSAGGDLSGSYPNPSVADGAITPNKLKVPATFISSGLPDAEGLIDCNEGYEWADWLPNVLQSVGYYRAPDGIVYLQGAALRCSSDPSGIIFTLPPGYRPEHRRFFFVRQLDAPGGVRVTVEETGDVGAAIEPNSQVSLDGIDFRCGPSGENGCP